MQPETEKFWPDRGRAVLVVVDVQQRLVPSMDPEVYRKTLSGIDMLVRGAEILQIPVLATEQYPKGLGPTVPELADACRTKVIEKMTFGCCGEPSFLDYLQGIDRSEVIVVGMEAHVCVYQTVLGLLQQDYRVHLVRDAIISRGKVDYRNAIENAARAGAIVTTAETVLFQLLRAAGTPEFKAVSKLVKERSHRDA
jgi:nicotinamidase-related amidase